MYKLLLLTAITLHFSTSTKAQDFAWAHRFGSTTSDVAYSNCGDAYGNHYVTGYFNGTADFDPGPGTFNLTSAGVSDIFVLKLSAEGELIWARQIGGTGTDQGNDITVDDRGYVILTGNFEDTVDFDPGSGTANLSSNGLIDVFVLKLDPDGNFNWVRQIGGPEDDAAAALTTDLRGNVYTCGSYRAMVDFDPGAGTQELTSAGESDVFILKLDWKGDLVWAKSIGGIKIDVADDLTVDADGNVYTLGEFRSTADFDPGPGTANMTITGFYSSLFVQKMDHDGNYVWAKKIGGSYFQYGNAIKINPAGELLITGNFSETTDFDPGPGTMNLTAQGFDIFVLSLSNAGNLNWVNHIVGNSSMTDSGESLDIGADGSIYVCGHFSQTADFNAGPAVQNLTSAGAEDGFLMKLDPAGTLIWARRTGGTNSDNPRSLYLDPFDNIYTVGSFWGTSDYNPLPAVNNLVSMGGPDIFVQKLSQNWNFSGLVFHDLNTNGVQDTDEIGLRSILISVPETGVVTSTDEQGRYHIYSDILGDTLKAVKPRPYWVVAPEFAIPDSMETPMNFALSIPYEPDLCLASVNTTRFRPGFTSDVVIQIVNTGFVVIDSATVDLLVVTEDSPGPLQFVSGSPVPEVLPNDHYQWKIVPPPPGGTSIIVLTLRTLPTTPINTPFAFSTSVGPEDDVYPANNQSRSIGKVVSSVDPNDKEVSPPGLLPGELDTSTLQYVIRFQNTGNYPAEFVVIRDTLPQGLDLATLQVFGASNAFNWRLYGDRILEFRFDPIVLPDSISDEPGSHGFVVFQIKPRAGLHAGDSISNRAGIYFDYNEPVITPAAVFRVIDISSGTAHPGASTLEFGLSPNPVSRNAPVRLELPESASTAEAFIAIYDQQGRLLRQMRSPAGQRRVYLSDLPVGVCVVQVGMNGLWGSKVLVVE